MELGVKFRVDVPGTVTAIKFYKGAADVGPHTGSLWTLHRHVAGHRDLLR